MKDPTTGLLVSNTAHDLRGSKSSLSAFSVNETNKCGRGRLLTEFPKHIHNGLSPSDFLQRRLHRTFGDSFLTRRQKSVHSPKLNSPSFLLSRAFLNSHYCIPLHRALLPPLLSRVVICPALCPTSEANYVKYAVRPLLLLACILLHVVNQESL